MGAEGLLIASAKSHSMRRAFHQPAFIGSCLFNCVSPVYQVVDEFNPCVLWPLMIELFHMVHIVLLMSS